MDNKNFIGTLLPHEEVLIRHFRLSNESDQHSIAEYAAQCSEGWKAYPKAGEYKPDPPDDLVHLHDASFDFEDYFVRHGKGELVDGEGEEFSARIYGMFCRDVFRSGGDMRRVSFWAVNYLAEKVYQALGGVPWEDIMHLPWDEPTPFLTPKGERAAQTYCNVENALRASPESNVTDLIYEQSRKRNVSFETSRADYYAYKKIVEQKTGIPEKFLNRDFSK